MATAAQLTVISISDAINKMQLDSHDIFFCGEEQKIYILKKKFSRELHLMRLKFYPMD